MKNYSIDCVNLSNFDLAIQSGNLIAGSELMWLVKNHDIGIEIRNINSSSDHSTLVKIGLLNKEVYSVVCAKDFEYEQQHYLLISLEINSINNDKRYLLALFQISTSKVICSFEVPTNVTKIEILVKNKHFIDNNKNPTILRNFNVTAICACNGGAVYLFDITPHDDLIKWNSDEYSPLNVYWYKSDDFTDYDEINDEKRIAHRQSQIFGLHLNYKSINKNNFNYIMPNDKIACTLPSSDVKITTIKYEKQIDSLLIGFNFGCFQIWNLKTMSIEISTGYGENTRPIIGFSLLQPQNDPKKVLYLLVSHSSLINLKSNSSNRAPPNSSNNNLNKSRKSLVENELNKIGNINETRIGEDEDLIDEDDDDENNSSFVLLYQILFERSVNVFLNQNESYHLYENIQNTAIVFNHELTSDTLKCVKTNNVNELNNLKLNYNQSNYETYDCDEENSDNYIGLSKIVSIQTLNIPDKQSNFDLASIIWTLMDKNSPSSSVKYYLSIFNLNNWYVRCMPSKMKQLSSSSSSRNENIYFSNFALPINDDFDTMKLISVVDAKLKKHFNQNALSYGNSLKNLINSNSSDETDENNDEFTETTSLDNDTVLSMSFDIVALTSFSLLNMLIKPIEQEIHDLISSQEDLVHNPDLAYNVLCRFHLIDKYMSKSNKSQSKFIQIFDYLYETSQIYVILKSLWILNSEDTCVISDFSLKVVLDWSWSKFTKIKTEINKINKLISSQLFNYLTYNYNEDIEHEHLSEFFQRQNNLLDNLIQIYKQFIKLNASHQGQIELNKKLCLIECLKCYVEHLNLFHKFELLVPPELNLNSNDSSRALRQRNLVKETDVNFKIIANRWIKRREDQLDFERNTCYVDDQKYPFTFMLDCLIEECKQNCLMAKFLTGKDIIQVEKLKNYYPPKSFHDLLEICLEPNLSTKLKQIIILYVLCDLMHTEFCEDVKKQLLKIINAYCSASFTIMSTTLDASLSVPWSSSSTSIIAVGTENSDNPNNSSCLFDLVNGLYLIDSRHIEKAFNYLRTAEINYLEMYEKYFILYNSLNAREYKLAIQYLWLFQKLNTSTMSDAIRPANQATNQTSEQNFFRFFSKSNTGLSDLKAVTDSSQRNEQYMHLRVMITIYLANTLWNEAFEFVKPLLKQVKSNKPDDALSKEIFIHFFLECEKFCLTKQTAKVCESNQDLNEIYISYLEAKQDAQSISLAINLHIENRNYARACYLYNKYNKQLSGDRYLASLIDEIKSENQREISKHVSLITQEDIRKTINYKYRFNSSLVELCKNSKRCMKILANTSEDSEYINLMKLPDVEHTASNITLPDNIPANKIEETTLLSKSSLDFSILKRTSSTPHSVIANKKRRTSPILKSLSNHLVAPYSESRTLTSSLKNRKDQPSSVSKSVKFLASRTTRRISENERYVDKEEQIDNELENEENENKTINVKLFLNEDEDDDAKEKTESETINETTQTNTFVEKSLNELPVAVINNETEDVNSSFKAAKAEIEAEIFSSKIEFRTDLHLFSSVTPTKTLDKKEELDAKNTLSLPVNKTLKSCIKLTFLVGKKNESSNQIEKMVVVDANQETETIAETSTETNQLIVQEENKEVEMPQEEEQKQAETQLADDAKPVESISTDTNIHNYSNNISMEECSDTSLSTTQPASETTVKEQRKAEIDSELYDAKLNFKANLSFFNSVTPSRLENSVQQKNLDFKNRLSLPASRFKKAIFDETVNEQERQQEEIIEEQEQPKEEAKEDEIDNKEENRPNIVEETPKVEEKQPEIEKVAETIIENESQEEPVKEDINEEKKEENSVENQQPVVEENIIVENEVIMNEDSKEVPIELILENSKNEINIQTSNDNNDQPKDEETASDDNKEEFKINQEVVCSTQTDTEDSELPDLVPRRDDLEMSASEEEEEEEETNECVANKTGINDITLKPDVKSNDEPESETESSQANQESSQQSEATAASKVDLDESITSSKSSVLIDCTLDQDTIESEAKENKDVDNSSNASFDLNMHSISANNSPTKLISAKASASSANDALPSHDDTFKSMSRNSSVSSLFSHISSVSQQFERNETEETDEPKQTGKRITRRRIQPSSRNKDVRHMDDNELSIKKANEEAIEGPGKASIRRRKSDLSSSSSASSVVSTANLEAVAKLRANLQQIPSTFGSNDQEVRVTRSKLRALIEPAEEIVVKESKPVTRTRSARTTKKQLEQLSEESAAPANPISDSTDTTELKMSISNLKKHNAAYDRLDSLAKQSSTEVEEEIISVKRGSKKSTRSATTRSPSPTASSIVSESTVVSIASVTTKTRGTRGKTASSKAKQEPIVDENDSPTESLASVASTSSRYSMRERRGATAAAADTAETKLSPSKAYGLRSKGKSTTSKSEDNQDAPGQAKVKRTRSKTLKTAESETHKLEAITESECLVVDSEETPTASQEVVETKPTRTTRTRRTHK